MDSDSCNDFFENIIKEISVLRCQFIQIYGDEFLKPKVVKNPISFDNFELNEFDFVFEDDYEKFKKLDKEISDKKISLAFEEKLLSKKKDVALKNLDIVQFAKLVKEISNVHSEYKYISSQIESVMQEFKDEHFCRVERYGQIIDMFENDLIMQQEDKATYDNDLINVFWLRMVAKTIEDKFKGNCSDIDAFFELEYVKDLLGNDYHIVRQKVGNLCGSK